MKRQLVGAAAAILMAACAEDPTGPEVVLGISWLEWPAALAVGESGQLRISSSATCTYRPVHRVALRNNELQVTTRVVRLDAICPDRGSGAGYDTVLMLPRLPGPPNAQVWNIRATMAMSNGLYRRSADFQEPAERVVGYIELRPEADTTTKLAGFLQLRGDSAAGCWVGQPMSQWPQPQFAFSRPVPLAPAGTRSGFVMGRLVSAAPAICGQSLAIDATELTVDATP